MNKSLNNNNDIRLKRLAFRSSHRGCKESDLVLGAFASQGLTLLSPPELDTYEAFLEEDDAEIWDWLVGKAPPPREDYINILDKLRAYKP